MQRPLRVLIVSVLAILAVSACTPEQVQEVARAVGVEVTQDQAASLASYASRPPDAPVLARQATEASWAALRKCESGGNYSINTGNGYYGAYQFNPKTWRSVGGSGLPHQASAAEQDKRAKILYSRSGRGQWPICGRKLVSQTP